MWVGDFLQGVREVFLCVGGDVLQGVREVFLCVGKGRA